MEPPQEMAKRWEESQLIAEEYINIAINSKAIIKKGSKRMKKYLLNRGKNKVKDMLIKLEKTRVEYLSSKTKIKNL